MHARRHGTDCGIGHFHSVQRRLVIDVHQIAVVIGLDAFEQMSLIVLAAAHQRGDVIGQLQRREQVIGLADGGGQRLAVRPFQAVGFGVFRGGQRAAAVADLNAGGATQAELLGVVVDGLDAGQTAHLIEKVVARNGDGLTYVHAAVGISQPPDPALGLGIFVEGIHALVLNGGGGGDDAGFQRGHRRDHFKGGAGGIGAVNGPVEHGQAVVGQQGVVVPAEGGQVKAGVGGQCQHLAGAHLDHGGCAAPLVAVLVDHALDGGGESRLGGGLQIQIQRQGHGVAGLWLVNVHFAGGFALVVGGDQAGAVLSPQPLLKGLFRAALAHQRIHGIPLVPVIWPVLGVNAGDAAQNVGGGGGSVLPQGGLSRSHADKMPVGDLGDQLRGHILGKNIAAAAIELIAHAGDEPGLRVGIRFVNAEQRPQGGQHLMGRQLVVELGLFQKIGEIRILPGGKVQVG